MDKSVVSHQPAANLPSPLSYSFDQIGRMAAAFAKGGLFGVKDVDQALSLMFYAQATGRHPALIMRDYDIIQGRLAKKSETMLRDFQASGGRVKWTQYNDAGAEAIFTHPLSPDPVTVKWDLDRAKKAGLAGKDGSMYTKYPAAMFRSRVVSEGVRTTAPDATEAMYTPQELQAMAAEETPEPVTVTAAVTQVADESKKALSPEELKELIDSMEVKTIPELMAAFEAAYTRATEARDSAARKKIKSVYDEIKVALETGVVP